MHKFCEIGVISLIFKLRSVTPLILACILSVFTFFFLFYESRIILFINSIALLFIYYFIKTNVTIQSRLFNWDKFFGVYSQSLHHKSKRLLRVGISHKLKIYSVTLKIISFNFIITVINCVI